MDAKSKQVAIDGGFSDVKVIDGKRMYKFPAAIARWTEVAIDLGIKENLYEFEGNRYWVGKEALHQNNILYYRGAEFLARFYPLLIAHAMGELEEGEGCKTLAVGLPIGDYDAHRAELTSRLSAFTVNERVYSFKNVHVYPQAIGALADYLSFASVRGESGLVLDIGYYTVIGLRFLNGRAVRQGTFQHNRYGISRPFGELEIAISKGRRFDIGPVRINQIVRTGKVPGDVNGEIDVHELLRPIMRNYIDELLAKIHDSFGEVINNSDRIILCGGGAHFIREFLPADYIAKIYIPEAPEFANVRGFFRLSGE